MPNNRGAETPIIDLVTGATSGIGRLLVELLLKEGHEVRVLLRQSPATSDEWTKLPPNVELYVADLRSSDASETRVIEEACKDVDNIFHIAGATYNYRNTFDELIDANVVGTDNLLSACQTVNRPLQKNVHVIFASSCTVYGYRRPGETLTEESELKPASPYSESKEMAERVVESYAETDPKMHYTTLRFGTLYGLHYTNSFFKIFELIKAGKAMYIGTGGNHLTLIHENDAVRIMFLAAQSPKALNRVYNATDGQAYTVKSLFGFVADYFGVKPPSRHISHTVAKIIRPIMGVKSDELEFVASDRIIRIDRARTELGFAPKERMEKAGLEMLKEFDKTHK
ncbi:MAG: NAD(P)-dependent oxidoreductase [Candidatus Marsarchaeota archaeon]|jgi:nucleoside-diphosphate-sugar epimerase|nr:NAD(P)-dependent oxidoreductase [Candidatus Marsarchaeota archaeon]